VRLFNKESEKGGKGEIQAADVETNKKGGDDHDHRHASGFFPGRPGDFGEFTANLRKILQNLHECMITQKWRSEREFVLIYMGMSEQILKDLESRLQLAVEAVKKDLGTVRTGRAKPSLVEEVKVEAYGSIMEVRELASISAPDTTLIVIAPWDKSLTGAIANGVRKAELNLNPIVDGEMVKIAVPALNEERRKELVKLVGQKIESGRVMLRQIRTEIKEEIEAEEGGSGVSEDDIKWWLSEMQRLVDKYGEELTELSKDKEQELMTI